MLKTINGFGVSIITANTHLNALIDGNKGAYPYTPVYFSTVSGIAVIPVFYYHLQQQGIA